MLDVLLVTFPFFVLVLAGFVAALRGLLPLSAIPGLNSFVLYFALPALLYRFGSSTPIARLVNPAVFGVWLLCAALLVTAIVATSRNTRIGWSDAPFGALVTAFPNTGFMGVPLLVALLGDEAAGTAIITIVVGLLFTSSLRIALSRLESPGGAGQAAKNALRGVLVNPLPWAVIAGGVVSATQLEPWGPIGKTVGLLAERFGADTGRIARIILLTTAAAFLTFSGVVTLLR